jgi:hypothetical protein
MQQVSSIHNFLLQTRIRIASIDSGGLEVESITWEVMERIMVDAGLKPGVYMDFGETLFRKRFV